MSSDGRRVIITADDSTARVWNATSGVEITVLRGHQGPIQYAIFSRDEARVVTASDDGTVRLWEAGTGAELSVLGIHTSWVNRVAFDPGGTRIVTRVDRPNSSDYQRLPIDSGPDRPCPLCRAT